MDLLLGKKVYTAAFSSETFFGNNLVDIRFVNSGMQTVTTGSAKNSDTIRFQLHPMDNGWCYRLNNMNVYVECKLLKENGEPPDTWVKVGDEMEQNLVQPVNNLGHNLFESVEYSIKGEMINGDSKNYNTKANILTALESAKCSPPLKLNGAGYYGAVQVVSSDGIVSNAHRSRYGVWKKEVRPEPPSDEVRTLRPNVIRDDPPDPPEHLVLEYKPTPVAYEFKLKGDLMDASVPLCPGLGVDIKFVQSNHAQRVRCYKEDPEKYELHITEIKLFVQVSRLADSIYKDFKLRIKKHPAVIPYKKYGVTVTTLPLITRHTIQNLFTRDSPVPSKLVIVFMRSRSKTGSYSSSSQLYARAWNKNSGSPVIIKSSNKPGEDEAILNEDDYYWIQSVKLTRNEKDFDMMDNECQFRNCMMDYRRMAIVEGYDSSSASGISYSSFLFGGYYMKCYDLTANMRSHLSWLTPMVKPGPYKIEIAFSEQPKHEIDCIVFAEYNQVLAVHDDNKVRVNYLE